MISSSNSLDNDQLDTDSISVLAEIYHRWGWSILPLQPGTKKASDKWKHRQRQRPTADQVARDFPSGSDRNIGIILGRVSGGVIVCDFDDADDYRRWAEQHADLAAVLPTVQTGRGFHVYFIDSGGYTGSQDLRKRFGIEGEIKGNGTYVVAPPSVVDSAESGQVRYRWIVPPRIDQTDNDLAPIIPVVDGVACGLFPAELRDQTKSETHHAHQVHHNHQVQSISSEGVSKEESAKLADLVERYPIRGPGQRNSTLFGLAIELRSRFDPVPAFRVISEVHHLWWQRFGVHAMTDEDVSLGEFADMVTRATGSKMFVHAIRQQYEAADVPKWIEVLGSPCVIAKMGKLAQLIVTADQLCGAQPFFLSCKTIAAITGVSATTAYRHMQTLAHAGVIEIIDRGDDVAGGLAATYRLVVETDGRIRQPLTDQQRADVLQLIEQQRKRRTRTKVKSVSMFNPDRANAESNRNGDRLP